MGSKLETCAKPLRLDVLKDRSDRQCLTAYPTGKFGDIGFGETPQLAVILEFLPELGPRLPQPVAHKNVRIANRAVTNPELVTDMTGDLTRLERALCEVARHAYNDHCLWWRIAIPAKPVRVHPADCPRQPTRTAEQIDCSNLACIGC